MLSQLQEATQSHHLGKHKSKGPVTKTKGSNKKNASSSSTNHLNRKALILFEDVDLVFGDQDEGFYSAVSGLVSTTKRPIVLTSSDENFSCKKLMRNVDPRVFKFAAPQPSKAARNLQLMCLSEGFPVDTTALECLLSRRRGRVAPAMLDLQFWALSGPSVAELALEEDEEEDIVARKRTIKPLNDDDSQHEEAAVKDSLLELVGLSNKQLKESVRPVRPFDACVSDLLGIDGSRTDFGSADFMAKLFGDGADSRELCESSLVPLLPFKKEARTIVARKRFLAGVEAKKFKRIAAFDFLQQSSESDGETDRNDNEDKKESDDQSKSEGGSKTRSKNEIRNILGSLDAIMACTEVRSKLHSPRIEHQCDNLEEMILESRLMALNSASNKVQSLLESDHAGSGSELTVTVSEDEVSSGSLVGAYRALRRCREEDDGRAGADQMAMKTAMSAVLDLGSQLAPRYHLKDTLPALRSMVRSEEVRRASGDCKKSRSGRFLNYLECEEIYLEGPCVKSLCDTLL